MRSLKEICTEWIISNCHCFKDKYLEFPEEIVLNLIWFALRKRLLTTYSLQILLHSELHSLNLSQEEIAKFKRTTPSVICTDERMIDLNSLILTKNQYLEQLFIENTPNLKTLDITGCISLQQILIRCQSLNQLKIGYSQSLSHLILDTTCITDLDTNDFPNLKSCNIKSPELVAITFLDDNKLEEITLDCPSLKNYSELRKCTSLQILKLANINIPSFVFELPVDTGPLMELSISSQILTNLNILTASNVRKFELNCPVLTDLELYRFCSTLSSTKHLYISLQCPQLKQTRVRGHFSKWFSKYFPNVKDLDDYDESDE